MRTQTIRVLDGKVDLSQETLAKLKPLPSTDLADFLRNSLGRTESDLADLLGPLQSIAKNNPYHDEEGKFTTQENDADGMSEFLAEHVDLSVPIKRISTLNEAIESRNAIRAEVSIGSFEPLPLLKVPDNTPIAGVTDSDVREAFSKENVSVYMAMSAATLKKVLAGDEIKNSLQTGKGTFKTIGEDRAVKEKEFLGVKADPTENPEAFPKYGYIAKKGLMDYDGIVAFGYGDVYVEFDDELRSRTTVTVGDSFNNNSNLGGLKVPAPLNNMGVAQLKYSNPHLDSLVEKSMEKYKESKDFYDMVSVAEYAEAQVYGKLSASNIKAVHVESAKTADALQKAVKKSGLAIKVVPTKTHTRLKQLAGGEISAWDKVDASDLSNLGDSYIEPGFTAVGSNLWASGWKSELATLNVPITKQAILDYPNYRTAPIEVKRQVMDEYMRESAKGPAGTFPKVLHRKPSGKGFTEDVFNKDLLMEYPK